MDRSHFAQCLRDAVIGAVQRFRQRHPADSLYGFAIVEGQGGNYLGYAVATEEGLRRIAAQYDARGYRYQGWEWEQVDNQEKLAVWLRWANPDDGWHYGDFPKHYRIAEHLQRLVADDVFGEHAEQLEEFCTDVLASLQTDSAWQSLQQHKPLIAGVTEGEDPRDFLRTATRCNPYSVVRQLWFEQWQADECGSRIKAPD